MKPGNINFLEPSGPPQTCNGTALFLKKKRYKEKERNDNKVWVNHHKLKKDVEEKNRMRKEKKINYSYKV